jgi:hypothetical protein
MAAWEVSIGAPMNWCSYSKHRAVIKQTMHKAMSGNISAVRTYLERHQIASEKAALREAAQARELERRNDVKSLSDEELMRIAAGGLKDTE